jgi:hypothetical protein
VQQVAPPHFNRVEAEFGGHRVEQGFEAEADIHRAVAAHRAAGRRIGIHAVTVVLDRGYVVKAVEQRARVEDGDQPVAAVGTAALHHLGFAGRQAAVAGHAQLDTHLAFRPAAMGEESLLAALQQAHRAARGARQQAADDLEIERFGAMAEAAADEGLDDADVRRLHLHAARQRQVHVVGYLGHRPQGQMAAFGIPGGQRSVGFHHGVMDLGALVVVLAHQVGCSKAGRGVAELVMHLALDVARLVVVQQRGIRLARIGGAEVGRQFAHPQAYQRQRGVGRGFVDRGHGGDRVADVAHPAAGQGKLVLRDRDHTVGHVALVAGNDRSYSGQRQGCADIDFEQFGMGVWAAQ